MQSTWIVAPAACAYPLTNSRDHLDVEIVDAAAQRIHRVDHVRPAPVVDDAAHQ